MWIKISPEQGHAARTHTPRKHSAAPIRAPAASSSSCLAAGHRAPSQRLPAGTDVRACPVPTPPPAHRGTVTRRSSWLPTHALRGCRGHLPMQGQGGTHVHTELARQDSHLTGTYTVPVHRPHAHRRAAAPTAFGTHTEAKRHYGRHSLGFVLLIVSTGLNVSGQFYLHIAE